MNYQHIINQAELHLIKGEKVEALNTYYHLLTNSDGNFSKDIYNSLVLANELNKIDTFFVLLDLVKKKNFPNEYLSGLLEFNNLHNTLKWNEFIETNNKVIYIDTSLRNVITALETRDQLFRKKAGSYSVYGDTIREIDSLNMTMIISLISKQGLPGERDIGAIDFSGKQGYDIVLHHHSQKRSNNKNLIDLIPILTTQVLEGRIEPNKCAHYLEMQDDGFSTGVFQVQCYVYNEKYSGMFVPDYSENKKLLIDKNRKSIGLESLEDYYKKVKFVTANKDNKYKFDVRINYFHMSTEKDFLEAQKRNIELN
jgi:Icc-related predicted phosphoesterase